MRRTRSEPREGGNATKHAKNKKPPRFKRFRDRRGRFERLGIVMIDWKDVPTLQRLCTGQGKLLSRKRAFNSARSQRLAKLAVKRARFMALLPYVGS